MSLKKNSCYHELLLPRRMIHGECKVAICLCAGASSSSSSLSHSCPTPASVHASPPPNHQRWYAKGSSVETYTHCIHVYARLVLILCAHSVLINKISASKLRRKFIKSALLVGQPTNVFFLFWGGGERERGKKVCHRAGIRAS